jgi:hypothetical protein
MRKELDDIKERLHQVEEAESVALKSAKEQ